MFNDNVFVVPNRQTYCSAKHLDCQGLIKHCTQLHYIDKRWVVSHHFGCNQVQIKVGHCETEHFLLIQNLLNYVMVSPQFRI